MIRVTAAIISKDNKYLIARKKKGNLAGLWEFPGGKIEPNETPEECLQREIKEEFDIDITVDSYLATSRYTYPHAEIELIGYHATYIDGELKPIDHDLIEWVTPEEMAEYNFAPADLPLVEALFDYNNMS
ncbi:MAG: (deoxy)nucleoside triphosphate pyrophosphohydrolase [Halanaerobiales bacterium]|nr:(deoxy)nucleoside triphosphate pyrophosphohydrolase [Halanaerobiales bacterium]